MSKGQSSGVGTVETGGGTLYPQVHDLYPLYPPSQRCGLCQNFKQTTLTKYCIRFVQICTPQLTKTFRRAWAKGWTRTIGLGLGLGLRLGLGLATDVLI